MSWQPIATADKSIKVVQRSTMITGVDANGIIHKTFWIEDEEEGVGGWFFLDPDTDTFIGWEPVEWLPLHKELVD